MFKVIEAKPLSSTVISVVVEAPRVAQYCQPGQFLILVLDDMGERVPLTICDFDREKGTIQMVFQPIGVSTIKLSRLKAGDYIRDVVGPLGKPSDFVEEEIETLKNKKYLFVGGGVGTAPILPQIKWFKERGLDADVIIGAKSKDILILEDEMRAAAGSYYPCTDDGTYGHAGMVTGMIEELIEKDGKHYDVCVAIGPMIMMKFVCLTTKKYDLHTVVSMNPIMVDGTGMCGACRLLVDGEVKFACIDGPEFDGHLVDFDLAMKRAAMYKTEEGRALLRFREGDTHHGGCGNCGGDE